MIALLGTLLVAAPSTRAAAGAGAGSAPVPVADSAAATTDTTHAAVADTTRAAADSAQAGAPRLVRRGFNAAAADTGFTRFEQPHWVMLRSLVVPGWGQWVNGSRWKALAVAGTETWFGALILSDTRALDRLQREFDAAPLNTDERLAAAERYNTRLSDMVTRQWLLAGVVIYSLTDAYVDAHFRHFKMEFEHDPALPEGTPVPGRTRLSIGWRF